MDNISPVVSGLHQKVEKLVSAYNHEKGQVEKLGDEVQSLKMQLEEQKKIIEDLQNKYKVIKLAKSISGENGEARDLKLKINELVREIDKCMALLNN